MRVLGFSSVAAYAVERCGYSGRWVEEARGLARRLAGLPRLRAALVAGDITWSMAQLVARHATGESEAERVAAARGSTVRAMKAWAFERARMIVQAVTGETHEDVVVETMLAETLTSILPRPGASTQ